jgi:hypothetical protein
MSVCKYLIVKLVCKYMIIKLVVSLTLLLCLRLHEIFFFWLE